MGMVIMGIRCSIYDSGWLLFYHELLDFFFLSLIGAFYIYYKTKVFNFLLTSFGASTIFHITNFFFLNKKNQSWNMKPNSYFRGNLQASIILGENIVSWQGFETI